MSTTSVFAELIVVGLGASVWIALLVSRIFGSDWTFNLGKLFNIANVPTSIGLIALVYSIGIVVDEICDFASTPLAKRIRRAEGIPSEAKAWKMQAEVQQGAPEAAKHLQYMRSRLRIVRAAVPNSLLSIVFLELYVLQSELSQDSWRVSMIWGGGAVFLIAAIASSLVYWRLASAYWRRVISIYESSIPMGASGDNEAVKADEMRL